MRILVSYRGIPQSRGWATGDSVVRAFRNLGHDAHAFARYYQRKEWIEEPESLLGIRFDLLLFMECNDGDGGYPYLQAMKFGKRASWYFDSAMTPEYQAGWKNICNHFDHNFIANKRLVDAASRTHFLPYAADRELHVRRNPTKRHDITLVGSDRPERRALVAKLQDAGLSATLVSGVFREQYIDTLAASWLSLSDVAGGGGGMLPMRVFEAPAACSLLVTPAGEGAEEVLGSGRIQAWDSEESLIDGCRTLLQQRDEDRFVFESYLRCVQDHILSHHTYEDRCREILRVCGL